MSFRMLFSLMVLSALATTAVSAATPPVPATPAAVDGILFAQPFTVDEPYHHEWQAERPLVSAGMILVLQVNPELVIPRQTPEPVLYVGHLTAERVNSGYPSGVVVAIVPGDVNLGSSPVWFGDPALPEQVTTTIIGAQRYQAVEAGIGSFGTDTVDAALRAGDQTLKAADYDALRRRAAELVRQYASGEEDLADGIMAPPVKK
jgi:hypothetical protein